jgi:hypothetical protein
MIHRRMVLFAGAAAIFAARPAHAADDTPAAVISAIYKRASAGKGESGGQFVWLKARDRLRRLSKSLVALWARADANTPAGDQGPIGFDPITNSQDPLVQSFEVAVERQDAGTATVVAIFAARKGNVRAQPHVTVRYDMVREAGRWMIDDIRGDISGQAWTVRDMLTRYRG